MGRPWVTVYYINIVRAQPQGPTCILAITKFTTIDYVLYNLVDTTLDVQLEFFHILTMPFMVYFPDLP